MKNSKTIFWSMPLALSLLACEKSPAEYFRELTAKKVQRPTVAQQYAANTDHDREPSASIGEPSTITKVVDSLNAKHKSTHTAPYRMCHALLKTMKTEPYFYQFQANLREYRLREEHGRLVKGHVKYHGIDFAKTDNIEPYKECADIVASFDRYQEVKLLWRLNAWDASDRIKKHLLTFRSGKKFYPIDRCSEVIASLKDDREFAALVTELSRSSDAALSPEIMMGSMMEAGVASTDGATIMITPAGCIKALKSFASFDDVQTFAQSDAQQRREMLGVHSSVIVAH